MSKRSVIHRVLSSHLNNNYSSPNNLSWENVSFTPSPNSIWIDEKCLYNDSEIATVGISGVQKDYGIYHLNIYAPLNRGTIAVGSVLDELTEIFRAGTILVKENERVYIDRTTPSQGLEMDNWYVVPFSIYWTSHQEIN